MAYTHDMSLLLGASSLVAKRSDPIPMEAERDDSEDLVYVAFNGQFDKVAKALRRPGVDVNEADPDGSTPLMAACWGGHAGVVKALLAAGANIHLKNKTHGWNALISAASQGHFEIVVLLLEAGADPLALDFHQGDAICYAQHGRHSRVVRRLKRAIQPPIGSYWYSDLFMHDGDEDSDAESTSSAARRECTVT